MPFGLFLVTRVTQKRSKKNDSPTLQDRCGQLRARYTTKPRFMAWWIWRNLTRPPGTHNASLVGCFFWGMSKIFYFNEDIMARNPWECWEGLVFFLLFTPEERRFLIVFCVFDFWHFVLDKWCDLVQPRKAVRTAVQQAPTMSFIGDICWLPHMSPDGILELYCC